MLHCLARIVPLHASGARVEVRVASASLRQLTGLGGYTWEPALVQAPTLQMTLFNGDFQEPPSPGMASLPLQMEVLKHSYPWADECSWGGAVVQIWAGEAGQQWPWELAFSGTVNGYERKGQTLTLTAEVGFDDRNVMTRTYAGTGDAEGPEDLKGKIKPLAIGWPQNVQPVLINAVDSVYQFSGYGPIEAVVKLYERGSDFGAAMADYASYAALVAATITPGRWATCLAEGLVRLGAPEYGVITGDIKGHRVGTTTPRLTGQIITALAGIAGIDDASLTGKTLDALDIAVPYPASLVITAQIKFLDVARRMVLPCNHVGAVSLTGRFFAMPIGFDSAAAFTIDAQGRAAPQVLESIEQDVSPPFWRTTFGAARSWRVHSSDEISFTATLIGRGLYDAAVTYREGNWVSTADGATWIYVNGTASAGNAPPTWPTTSNAWWSNRTPPGGSAAAYSDGTPIDDLRPAEPGSDVTANTQVTITAVNSRTINANYAGTIPSGSLPLYVPQPTVVRGGTTITTSNDTSYAIQNDAGGCSGNVTVDNTTGSASKGVVTIGTGFNASGSYELVVTVSGVTYPAIKVTVTKQNGSPPSGGGGGTSGGFDPRDAIINSTSFIEVGRVSNLTVASGTTVNCYLSGNFNITYSTTNATRNLRAKWQYSPAGTETWTDIDTEAISSNATYLLSSGPESAGSITCNQSQSGLSAANYDIRLMARESSASSSTQLQIYDEALALVVVS